MIISRTPMRISIGGGGTDLPSYYEKFGGFVISAAINKYIYILLSRLHEPEYFLKYSKLERCSHINDIEHPLIREALRAQQIEPGIELVSVADVLSGTGLGSSGSFTVGLLNALHAFRREHATRETLAREAVEIEMERLGDPVGKQDQYAAAYGGIYCQEYRNDGSVVLAPLPLTSTTLRDLQDGLMLFYTGSSRSASALLSEQKKKSESNDASMIDALHFTKDLGFRIRSCLEAGDVEKFGHLMHEHWESKRKRSKGMSSPVIDEAYACALENGAIGGKLVGAGGGGFLMFLTENRKKLRHVMAKRGFEEMPFSFDFHGSIIQEFG